MLAPGVQDATRPRKGPSPPDRYAETRVHTNLLFARCQRTPGYTTKEVRHGRPSLSRPSQSRSAQASGEGSAPRHPAGRSVRGRGAAGPSSRSTSDPRRRKLADAQLALARSYGLPSWPRLVLACRMTDAIWRDDADAVRELVLKHPRLLHEDARGVKGNWGPPMSYAANLGRDRIIAMLRGLGAADVQFAFDRACLQGQIDTARQLLRDGRPPRRSMRSWGRRRRRAARASQLLLELGAEISDEHGDRLAPVALVLETYCRNPGGKHRCLELFAGAGHRSAGHAADGGASRPDRSARGSSAPRSRSARADLLPPRDLSARDWAATPTSRWRCTGRRWPARRCCTCASTTTRSRSRAGCSSAGPTRTRRRRSMPRALAGTRRCSAAWSRSPTASVCEGTTLSPACCSITAPIRTLVRRCGSGCGSSTDESMHEYRDVTPLAWGRAVPRSGLGQRAGDAVDRGTWGAGVSRPRTYGRSRQA